MQEIQVFQIDEDGSLVDVLMIPLGTILTEQVQVGEETVTDEEGNETVQPIYETRPRQDIIYERPPDGLFEPTWNGEEWVNGLSQEEIDEIRNRPVPPSETEILGHQIIEQKLKTLILEQENQYLGQQLVEQKLQSSSLKQENEFLGQQLVNIRLELAELRGGE